MRKKLFTLLLAVAASVGTMLAESVQIGDLYYNLDATNQTAEVAPLSNGRYSGDIVIPSYVTYNSVSYSVTSIGEWAFAGCSGLTSVTIPNSVTSIGGSAFSYCSGLTSVTIPNSVTSIGYGAFGSCSGLTSVTIPGSVTSIGNSAFSGCGGLTSVIWNAKNCADFASNNTPFYDLRSQITSFTFGNEVEYIPAYLCKGMSNLTSIEIPNSVTSIGEWAFSGCSGLTSVIWNAKNCADFAEDNTPFYAIYYDQMYHYISFNLRPQITSFTFGNEVEHIPANLCNGMSNLTSIEIPNSVTSIGERAFYKCTGLTSVMIPNSVTSIGNYAFFECSSLTSIIVENGNSFYDSRNNCNAIIETATNTLIVGCMNTIIPNSVTSIGDYAFSNCSGLTSVTIPNSVTSIGSGAFQSCSGLTSVTIPNSVTSIGWSAFSGCSGLTSVTIPNSVTSIGNNAFFGCSGLTSVTIPNSVTSIGDNAFYNVLHIVYSGEAIGSPWGAKYVNRYVDGYLIYSDESKTKLIVCSAIAIGIISIPNTVTSIAESAFFGCSGLTSITIPNSVTSIGKNAFSGCSGLTSVEAPAGFFDLSEGNWPSYTKNLNHVTVNGGELTENALLFINRSYKTLQTLDVSGVTNTEFADEAFKGYYNLQQLVLPEGLQKVSYMMVAGCKNLQSIDIPASVEEIEQSAFEDCRSIKTITFGGAPAGAPGRFNAPTTSTSQLRRIGNWAFYNAHELQNLEIPEGVTEIGDGAFYGCTYLEEMVLPSSVQTIGDNTFALCAKLQKITVNSVTPPSIQAKTFFDVKRQIPVYVPDEAVSAYEDDTYWQEFDIQGASQMPTGIDNVSSSLQGGDRGRLILHNGQIYILRGEKTYTLTGQEVK